MSKRRCDGCAGRWRWSWRWTTIPGDDAILTFCHRHEVPG